MIEINDADTCTSAELNNLFDHSLRLSNEKAISLKKDYLFHLDISCDFTKIASAESDKVHLFDLDTTKGFTQIGAYIGDSINGKQQVCGIRFWNENPHNVTIAGANGQVTTFDLRSANVVMEIENEQNLNNEFDCFDISAEDKYFCVGGVQNREKQVPILFYDIRNKANQHCYVDSHEDDVTQVKFHPTKSNVIVTGSTDGLINVFNIDEEDENDALLSSLNSESSIQTLRWHPNKVNEYHLSCITHTNDLILFDMGTEDIGFQYDRSEITETMKRKSVDDCYLIDCHTDSVQDIFVLAGSNFNNGECLRSLTVTGDSLRQRNNFVNNRQIVRCSVFNSRDDVLFTGGESGIISVWDGRVPNAPPTDSNKLKEKVHTNRKSKPY